MASSIKHLAVEEKSHAINTTTKNRMSLFLLYLIIPSTNSCLNYLNIMSMTGEKVRWWKGLTNCENDWRDKRILES